MCKVPRCALETQFWLSRKLYTSIHFTEVKFICKTEAQSCIRPVIQGHKYKLSHLENSRLTWFFQKIYQILKKSYIKSSREKEEKQYFLLVPCIWHDLNSKIWQEYYEKETQRSAWLKNWNTQFGHDIFWYVTEFRLFIFC